MQKGLRRDDICKVIEHCNVSIDALMQKGLRLRVQLGINPDTVLIDALMQKGLRRLFQGFLRFLEAFRSMP